MSKYEIIKESAKEFNGITLYRIKALVSLCDVSAGDIGGWIEKEDNLSHEGNAWVFGDARVYGDVRVYGNAQVRGDAQVCGDAHVSGNARVFGNARVCGNARVFGNAWVFGDAWVRNNKECLTIGPIGSESGTLTAFRLQDGSIFVNRGCFSGTIDEFEQANNKRHGDNQFGEEYRLVIALIKLRLK